MNSFSFNSILNSECYFWRLRTSVGGGFQSVRPDKGISPFAPSDTTRCLDSIQFSSVPHAHYNHSQTQPPRRALLASCLLRWATYRVSTPIGSASLKVSLPQCQYKYATVTTRSRSPACASPTVHHFTRLKALLECTVSKQLQTISSADWQ